MQISSLNKKLHEHIYAEKLQNICNVYFHKLISIKHLFILLSGLLVSTCKAQINKVYKNTFTITTDNDAYLFTSKDGYYTNGIFFQFSKAFDKKNLKIIKRIEVGQALYNSRDRLSIIRQLEDADRPYCGYLFTKYSYNATAPYTSQINPNAESFMQDYLKAHSKSLLKMKDWGLPYFNLIDNILSQYGLPKELKYVKNYKYRLENNPKNSEELKDYYKKEQKKINKEKKTCV